MNYTIYGPFTIQKQPNGLIARGHSARSTFWSGVEEEVESLPSACGCYVFAIRAARGVKPWYVGKAVKQSFEKECLNLHQLTTYNEVIAKRKGTPLLFLIAKKTKKGKFSKPGRAHQKNIDFLETVLIGAALDKNPKLMNIQKTKFLKRMCVPGFMNTPRRRATKAESEFRKVIRT
ncbi:MAG: hypothetical protein JXN61_04715 [Sedimentisphaerales bacterium]|nr:hypothetical protein [Sedimentisphaerales bacterium]